MEYTSFIGKLELLHESRVTDVVRLWVSPRPEWMTKDASLYLHTGNFDGDLLKLVYYYPGDLEFFVTPGTLEVKKIKVIFTEDEQSD